MEQKLVADDGGEINLRAKLNLVDLAGKSYWKRLMYYMSVLVNLKE